MITPCIKSTSKGCGKVVCANTDYDGKMVVCGKYGDFLCDKCISSNVQNANKGERYGN